MRPHMVAFADNRITIIAYSTKKCRTCRTVLIQFNYQNKMPHKGYNK